MEKKLTWKLSDRLISYFASSIYGENFDIIAIREALQNSVDAKAKTFRLHIINDRNVIIENNGKPMDLETIEKQLFVLGESTKIDGTSTGYFGVGECAIISPCEQWKIETGRYVIENFILRDTDKPFNGTKHTLKFRKPIRTWRIKEFLKMHNTKMKVIIQDVYGTHEIKPLKLKKCRKFKIPHGTFTWKKSGDPITVIRVNGVPQTYQYRYDKSGLWIIDLDSSELLTVNREQIRDNETKKAVEALQDMIRKLSEHVSGDKPNEYVLENAPYPFYRKRGVINRRNPYSKPLRKMYQCLKTLDEYMKNLLKENGTIKEFKHKIALGNLGKDSLAITLNGTIVINVYKRKLIPSTTFILCLIDDYCHELSHIYYPYWQHQKGESYFRRLIWKNPKIIETLRKMIR